MMMQRWLYVGLLTWSNLAAAVGLEFRELPVSQFAEAVFRQVLGRDYVISSAVAASSEKVSISIRELPADQVLELATAVLQLHGVGVIDRAGVLFLDSSAGTLPPMMPGTADGDLRGETPPATIEARGAGREVETYIPRHQPVALLAEVARFAGAEVVASEKGLPAVMFSGTADAVDKARRAMEKADLAPLSVNLRAALLEVTDSNEEQRSLSGLLSLFSGRLGITFGANAHANNALTFKGTGIDAILSAVDGDNRFRYLAEPSLRVVDGQQARLVVGSEVPVRGAVTLDNNGNAVQSVEYRTAGVQLTVSPRIHADVVVATIGQEISSFSTTTTSGIDSPTILKRSASTVVDLRDGEVVVLAGLDESRESESASGLSWLPFSLSRAQTAGRSRILLLMEVIRDHDRQFNASAAASLNFSKKGAPAGDDAVGAGWGAEGDGPVARHTQ
ncbi:hypothetical protein GO613_13905 [Azoarcus communis]|uniref:type II secretion system protein GspD n=1 Tax=Parazoarcus communis TaxID=41977 RepID=UPI001459649E|nr:hypothetical protein [Parazoarcus communis]NMG49198.1 hypothetical protein [Parazoarcus communis]